MCIVSKLCCDVHYHLRNQKCKKEKKRVKENDKYLFRWQKYVSNNFWTFSRMGFQDFLFLTSFSDLRVLAFGCMYVTMFKSKAAALDRLAMTIKRKWMDKVIRYCSNSYQILFWRLQEILEINNFSNLMGASC